MQATSQLQRSFGRPPDTPDSSIENERVAADCTTGTEPSPSNALPAVLAHHGRPRTSLAVRRVRPASEVLGRPCPVDAIKIDLTTGAKVVLDDVCVGCKVCTIACPFGTINYVQDTGKVQKCDLCGGDPACASACPTGAITYVDADWTGLERMRPLTKTSFLAHARQGFFATCLAAGAFLCTSASYGQFGQAPAADGRVPENVRQTSAPVDPGTPYRAPS